MKSLLEFCRAIHAEMDAITTAARNGCLSLKNAKLYCTTYPCHNCARHIITSGIKEVYYIEPYEKSLAVELHHDAITHDTSEESKNKVLILPFNGVSPRQFLNIFKKDNRKCNGKLSEFDPKSACPINPQMLEIFVNIETIIVKGIKDSNI